MTSESHKESIEFILSIFGKDVTQVICFVADNCNVNKCLARMCGVPMVGCAAHRFNLAVQEFIAQKENAELLNCVRFDTLVMF